jgi:hypothetical protein
VNRLDIDAVVEGKGETADLVALEDRFHLVSRQLPKLYIH